MTTKMMIDDEDDADVDVELPSAESAADALADAETIMSQVPAYSSEVGSPTA
jgi:hypothetical protein